MWQPSCAHEEQYYKYTEGNRMHRSKGLKSLMKSVNCQTNFGTAHNWISLQVINSCPNGLSPLLAGFSAT